MIENPAKIMLMGDTHGDGMWVVKAIYHARRNKANVIVQLGDFGWWHPAGRKEFLNVVHRALEECDITLYWVAGNHECARKLREVFPKSARRVDVAELAGNGCAQTARVSASIRPAGQPSAQRRGRAAVLLAGCRGAAGQSGWRRSAEGEGQEMTIRTFIGKPSKGER